MGRRLRPLIRLLLALIACSLLAGCFSSPPQIVRLTPNQGTTGVPADQSVTVFFDHPMEESSLAGRFHLTPSLPGCHPSSAMGASPAAPCAVTWAANHMSFTFSHHNVIFAPHTVYTFTLDAGLRDTSGLTDELDHHWQLTTARAPTVTDITPASGSTAAIDSPIDVTFDRGMSTVPTAAAITLTPAIPGTEVLPGGDSSRFVLIPGHPLHNGVTYTVHVGTAAADFALQHLQAPVTSSFTASGITPGGHAAILAGPAGGNASSVFISPLAPLNPGDPVPAELLLQLPTASPSSYASAALSPGGAKLAVVVATPGREPQLLVYDVLTGKQLADYTGGTSPAWSSQGSLAFVTTSGLEVITPDGGRVILAGGEPISGSPVWNPSGSQVAVPVSTATGPSIELASPSIDALYNVPGLSGPATNPVFSVDGNHIALDLVTGPQSVELATIDLTAQTVQETSLASNVAPLGYTAAGSIVGLQTLEPALVIVGSDGSLSSLPSGPEVVDSASTRVSPDGRELAYVTTDYTGVHQAWVETAAGSDAQPLTNFGGFGPYENLAALAVSYSA